MNFDDFIYLQLPLLNYLEEGKQSQCQAISLPDAEMVMYPSLFCENESDKIFAELYQTIEWKQEDTYLYGKKVAIPRLTAWYGDQGKAYTYSKIKMEPQPWISILEKIKFQVEKLCEEKFNSVLLNLYRDGKDSIAWHSDDEKELGKNPTIGSLSFGGTRIFMFRHRFKRELKFNVQLTHGGFLLMKGTTQHYWQHQIPKTRQPVKPRINLTFRKII